MALTTFFDLTQYQIGGIVNTIDATYTNGSGSTVTLAAGTLMGRVVATNKVKPCVASATDGSQVPIGILLAGYSVAASADQTVTLTISGNFDIAGITFGSGNDLSTEVKDNSGTISFGTLGDCIARAGIFLKNGEYLNPVVN